MPRAQQMNMQPLQWMVDESIAFILEHEPPEGYLLADSFGKDSTVLLELTKMAGVKYVHTHNFTGIDPPELTKFGMKHHSEARIIRPKMTMWEGIHKWFPPSFSSRWCCVVLKEFRVPGLPLNILAGIRAEESPRRKARGPISIVGRKTITKPIFSWLEWHVWEFIESMNLPYCELYDEGFNRLG